MILCSVILVERKEVSGRKKTGKLPARWELSRSKKQPKRNSSKHFEIHKNDETKHQNL